MKPKFEKGQMVRVFDYYMDGIIKNSWVGLIVSHERFPISKTTEHIIYEVLVGDGKDEGVVKRAEEFAIDAIEGE